MGPRAEMGPVCCQKWSSLGAWHPVKCLEEELGPQGLGCFHSAVNGTEPWATLAAGAPSVLEGVRARCPTYRQCQWSGYAGARDGVPDGLLLIEVLYFVPLGLGLLRALQAVPPEAWPRLLMDVLSVLVAV